MRNLGARIEGLQLRTEQGPPTLADRAALVEALSLRGHILGCIADLEHATRRAEQFVRDVSGAGPAFFARARIRSMWHRFSDAWTDLDAAQSRGMDPAEVDDERAAIHQAVGRYDEALAMRRDAAQRRADFRSFAALAGIHAERREIDLAERMFRESRRRYRGVSPFPLAMLDFEHGHLWLSEGELSQARTRFKAALQRLPDYATAQGHLAEIDAALGDAETSIARLRPLVASSDDPQYAAQLARLLRDLGRADESSRWRECAARRYDELVLRHAEAFADHAAEFWLGTGADPDRATQLARINLKIRATPQARELLTRAVCAQL
ncbi:MAG: tetratricopeptide repeat protein [Pseudonocardiales bacterium]